MAVIHGRMQLPSRAAAWNRDNLFVGRGATKQLSAVAATTAGVSSRNDGFRLDPPTPSPSHQGPPENTSPGYPFYRPPPEYRLVVPYLASEEPIVKSAPNSAEAAVETEVKTEEDTAAPAPTVKLSNKIHIVGFDTQAKFIAHGLAAVPNIPPAQIITHHPISMTKWGQEGRAIDVLDSRGYLISSRNIPCPELIHTMPRFRLRRSPIMENIIVSTAPGALLKTLARLRPCIDRRTTVCLVQPGLGQMELLNEHVFDVPALRPNYILCNSEHQLSKHSSFKYSIRHVPGQLLVHAVPRNEDADLDRKTAETLGARHTHHMIQLLSAAGDLNMVSLPWHIFLLQKLPDMIYQSLADTISVILGCRFSEIRHNEYAMVLWKKMLTETVRIVASLPEFRDHPWIVDKFSRPSFRRKMRMRLERSSGGMSVGGGGYSRWISMVRKGQVPPVDYFNGYFVRRAQETGVSATQNSLAVHLVKARQTGRYRELQLELPLGLQPYMQDADRIGGGQDRHDDEVDVDLES
ncbi:hypothetical protein GGR53DRAFT_518856 [Hypoxylon sp. FL1150]|nr:hypothetical protein GGR53DRAFT_518856 [Hypoxylon sp. FL1150]